MTTTVLAYIPSPSRGVWHLGPVPIRAYALFIIVGIVVALVIGDRRWAARGGERGVIYDIALWAVPFGLVGGRLYHLATDWRLYFGEGGAGPIAAVRIWDGGLGIWGAVALGGVGAWIGCRRRGIPLPAFGDAVAPGIVLAQAIGRLGNYFNQELYGRETTLPWGLEIFLRKDPAGFTSEHSLDGVSTGERYAIVQPTFLYELLWNLVVFAALIVVDRRLKIGHGRLFALYVAGYCLGRFCVELLRDDAATHIAGIRINSFTSTFVFIGAVVYLILAPKGREDPATLGGTAAAKLEPVPAAELASVAAASGAAQAAKVGSEVDSGEPAAAAEAEAVDVDTAEPADAEPATTPDEAEEAEAEAVAEEAGAEAVADEAEEAEAEAVADELGEPETEQAAQEPEDAETEEPEAEPASSELEAEEAVGEPDAQAEPPEASVEQAEEPEAEPTDEPEAEPTEKSAADATAAEREPAEADDVAEADAVPQDHTEETTPQVAKPTTSPLPRWRSRLSRLTRRSGR